MLQLNDFSVSTVVPVYNGEKYISEALRSLAAQTLSVHEAIIVDDGSKDGTLDLIRELQKELTGLQMRVITHDKNKGVSASRNEAIELAEGSWILFLDSEDIIKPELVRMQVEKLAELERNDPGSCVLVHGAYQQITESGTPIGGPNRFRQVESEEIFGYELLRNYLALSGTMVNKSAVKRVGGFDPLLRYSEDWHLWLRLAQIGGFGYVDEANIMLRRHPGNASRQLQTLLQAERMILERFDLRTMRDAIHRRHLPYKDNELDYIQMLFRLDRWAEGDKLLSDLISTNGDDPRLHYWSGIYRLKQCQWEEAAFNFHKVVELDSEHGASWNNLGAICAIQGDLVAARQCLEKALTLFPGYMDAEANLALLGMHNTWLDEAQVKFTWRELRPQLTLYTG